MVTFTSVASLHGYKKKLSDCAIPTPRYSQLRRFLWSYPSVSSTRIELGGTPIAAPISLLTGEASKTCEIVSVRSRFSIIMRDSP
jgi:hypothetical protein